jgi:hypothetical protein
MRALAVAVVFVVVMGVGGAGAEEGRLKAYVTDKSGSLYGRVVDDAGKPMHGVVVEVVAPDGKRRAVETDRDGRYQVTIAPGGATVFIHGDGRFSEQTMVTERRDGGQRVDIEDTLPPAVPAQLVGKPGLIPDYSEKAVDDDVWTRAWMLLDIDARGTVTRVKLLRRPGHDLDAIAVRAAMALRFKPARNRANRAIPSVVIWTFEWPSPTFLVRVYGTRVQRLPGEVASIPCRGTGAPNTRWRRDCTPVDVSQAQTLPWLGGADKR